ncbi:hypothetical protein CDL12_15513 [Handroanthus impetiginosus]|uniref:Uncharacterized protein n=1 Tax=Handroanthus impetiginosus TaxID=429701 RepID=A0A2G9H2Y5_9LAMI|nr:hypothetical protein CDL12_15513 [Handroanthus impetiginosus]
MLMVLLIDGKLKKVYLITRWAVQWLPAFNQMITKEHRKSLIQPALTEIRLQSAQMLNQHIGTKRVPDSNLFMSYNPLQKSVLFLIIQSLYQITIKDTLQLFLV